jgi:hypothetical protein
VSARVYFETEASTVVAVQRQLPMRVQVQLWKVTELEESQAGRSHSETTRELVQSWSLTPDEGLAT